MRSFNTCWLAMFFLTISVIAGPIASAQRPAADRKDKNKSQTAKIDLLKNVRFEEQIVRGVWTKTASGVRSDESRDALLVFPVSLLGNYEVEFDFTRQSGVGGISLSCPVFPKNFFLELGGWEDRYSGLSFIDMKLSRDLPVGQGLQVSPSGLVTAKKQKLHLKVEHKGDVVAIAATLEKVPIVAWQGQVGSFNGWGPATPPNPYLIGLHTHESVYDIHKLTVTPKSGCKVHQCEQSWTLPWLKVADEPPPGLECRLNQNGKRYFISDKPMPAPNAHALAAQLGGRLVTISSQEEFNFLMQNGLGLSYFVDGTYSPRDQWRDSRNNVLKIIGIWGPSQPQFPRFETQLGLITAPNEAGYHDFYSADQLHACIEWGKE